MRKYLIATHRKMAEGLVDTLHFFVGEHNIQTLCAYVDSNELSNETIEHYTRLSDEDELVIFTDIASGSVTQKFYPYLKNENIYMISGVSMPLILSVILAENEKLSTNLLDELIEQAKNQMQQLTYKQHENKEDE